MEKAGVGDHHTYYRLILPDKLVHTLSVILYILLKSLLIGWRADSVP